MEKTTYTIEYSLGRRQFFIRPLGEVIRENRAAMLVNQPNDCLLVGVAGTEQDAVATAATLREKLKYL